MDLVNLFLFCLMSCVLGAVLMLLIQYYAFVRYFHLPEEDKDDPRKAAYNERYILPDQLLESIKSPDQESKTTVMAINLILQFLYFELRHSHKVRKWVHRKLSLELDELISKTTIGKLFDKLSIRDLDLGSQFPEIKNFRLHNAEIHPEEGHIECLDLILDLHYQGNFRLSIDADMVLGKKGFLSMRVRHVSGLARLQFTRKPYTHWSLTFLGDPKLDLDVESQFQGRQIQSNVTSLISNQIRKAIRRKHTLPNYRLRYKPFFHRDEEDYDNLEVVPNGTLEITVSELSRLMAPNHFTNVYCTITLANIPWVLARQQDDKNLIVSLDLEIHKAKNQQIGIVFKQVEQLVIIEAVIPNTPASKADLKKNDVLLSIQGKRVTNITQVAKIIKTINRPMFILRIERTVPGVVKNDAVLEDYEEYEPIDDLNISFNKNVDSVQIGGNNKLVRKNSKDSGGESSQSNTASNSPRKSDDKTSVKLKGLKCLSRANSESKPPVVEEKKSNDKFDESYPQHSTIDCNFSSFIRMDDLCTFKLFEQYTYLNINVYGRYNEDNRLLGYVNIPLSTVLMECSESNLGHFLKRYSLLPPEAVDVSNDPLSSQSGFDQTYCYGDVLLSFVWNGTMESPEDSMRSSMENIRKIKLISITRGSNDKLDEDRMETPEAKTHNFKRTHFHRTTQCEYCGKKIWLKDAMQCRDCAMCCHKKCINKCQNSTVCGNGDTQSTSSTIQPEFRLTEPESPIDDYVDLTDEHPLKSKLETHRQSFSDLLAQGLKRVNSANNLSIPMVSGLNQSSKSLPPSPQHTPRKQSLTNSNPNPFAVVTQRLENLPDNIADLHLDQIIALTAPLIEFGSSDTLMALAKTCSKTIYSDLEPEVRLQKINHLLTKLHIALDCETSNQPSVNIKDKNSNSDTKNKSPSHQHESARLAFLVGQSEERVQALSVIMLHLCSGLQHAQGIAGQ